MDKKCLTRSEIILEMALKKERTPVNNTNINILKEALNHDIIIQGETRGKTGTLGVLNPSIILDSSIIEPEEHERREILEVEIDFQNESNNFKEPSVLNTLRNEETEFKMPNVTLVTGINYDVLAGEGQSPSQEVILGNKADFEELHPMEVSLEAENAKSDEAENEETHSVVASMEPGKPSSDDDMPLSKVRNEVKRNIKKRKHAMSRKERAQLKTRSKHPLRDPCKTTCKKGCTELIGFDQRKAIHHNYWLLSWNDQRKFILNSCSRMPVKRRTKADNSQRNMTFCYRLLQESGKYVDVCKTFYLGTLGYHHKNDKVIFNVLHKSAAGSIIPNEDQRGKNPPPNKIDRQVILSHVNSFNPSISHYRREHAPRVKYLPSDVTVKIMHDDFLEKFPQYKCGYEAYRKILFTENIRFTKLGNEECEHCEMMDLHPHKREDLNPECETCKKWSDHITRAKTARHLYQKHAAIEYNPQTICVSADLEKVIMLPRMENFKKVLFTQRLVLYNETFVPLGIKNKKVLPFAVVWHEAIRGRGKEELISMFFQFILHNRDAEHFVFWLDNCSAQNKNWAFMSFLVYIVNSSKIAAETILVNYFEPGHTFMSADSLHHQIELSLKRQKKTQDFSDFVQAIQKSNSGKVTTKVMNIDDFYDFKDFSSAYKRNKIENEKILLSNINQVKVCRGSFDLQIKSDLNSTEFKILNFVRGDVYKKKEIPDPARHSIPEFKILNFVRGDVYKKKEIPDPARHSIPCGIAKEKKDGMIKNLLGLMDDNRKEFWLNLPVAIDAEIVQKTCKKKI